MSMKRKANNISTNEGSSNAPTNSGDSSHPSDDPNNTVTKSTIFVKNLPRGVTNEKVEAFFSDIGPVRKIILVTDKGSKICNGLAYVNYTFPEDAETAIKKFHNNTFPDSNNRVKVERAKKREPRKDKRQQKEEKPVETRPQVLPERKQEKTIPQRPQITQKPTAPSAIDLHTIIIRNIPFQATEGILSENFSKFGKIEKVTIPMMKDDPTKMKGFAIVRFKNIASAKKAVEQMNAKEIMNRTVAVDFMLPTNIYQEQQNKKKQEEIEKQEEEWENQREGEVQIQDNEEELEDDDEEEEDDENEEEDDDEDFDNQEEEEEEEEEKEEKPFVDPAVAEGRVLFIKNLSFDTTQEDLKQRFAEYGNVSKVFLVMDHVTERPRGTAFVHFEEVTSADAALQDAYKFMSKKDKETGAATLPSSIQLDGRQLIVTKAVTRETAASLATKKKNKYEKEDKRNLYLAIEGHIDKESPAAEGVSKEDLEKRAKFYREKMLKLKNPNYSVSMTRLSIRNIPKNVTEKELRKICMDAAKAAGEKVIIKQVKLLTEESSSGVSKSKGIGFIEFAEHAQAMRTLRNVNNNPTLFGAKKRPIVEFAIDDARRIHVMQLKREKENSARSQEEEQRPVKRGREDRNQKRNNNSRPNSRAATPSPAKPQDKKQKNNNSKPNSRATTPSPAKQPQQQKPKKEKPPKKKLKQEERKEQKEEEAYQKLVQQYKKDYFGL